MKLGHPVPLSNLSKDAKSGSAGNHVDVEARLLVVPVFVGEGALSPVGLCDAVLLGVNFEIASGFFL